MSYLGFSIVKENQNRDRLDLLSIDILDAIGEEIVTHVDLISAAGSSAARLLANAGLWGNNLSDGPNLDGMFPWLFGVMEGEFINYAGFKSASDKRIKDISRDIYNHLLSEYPQIVSFYNSYFMVGNVRLLIAIESFILNRRGAISQQQEFEPPAQPPARGFAINEEDPDPGFDPDPGLPDYSDQPARSSSTMLYVGIAVIGIFLLMKK